jgi:hypothetical protein
MYPANSTLGAVLLPDLHRFAVTIRLEYILGTKSNTYVARLAPFEVYLQRRRASGVVIFVLRPRPLIGLVGRIGITHDVSSQ